MVLRKNGESESPKKSLTHVDRKLASATSHQSCLIVVCETRKNNNKIKRILPCRDGDGHDSGSARRPESHEVAVK